MDKNTKEKLVSLADSLDQKGFKREADMVDNITKIDNSKEIRVIPNFEGNGFDIEYWGERLIQQVSVEGMNELCTSWNLEELKLGV